MGIVYQNRSENITIKITQNNSYPPHIHKQAEIFFVLDGCIHITVGNSSLLMTKGMMSVAFPNIIHRTETPDSSTALLIIFDLDTLPDFYKEFMTMLPENPFITDCQADKEFYGSLINLLSCTDKDYDIRMKKGYLYLFLSILLNHMKLVPKTYVESDICQEIAIYLNTHFTEPLSLSELAAALGYSKYHISHIFKDKFGCSFTGYINRLRAEYAMGLLSHSGCSITEVCYASGFNSMRTFYRTFEEIYKIPPRKLISSLHVSH